MEFVLPDIVSLVLLLVVTAFASSVQAVLGMGFGLAAAPLLALLDPAFVPGPIVIIGLFSGIAAAWSERSAIDWSEVLQASVGRLLGVAAAMPLLVMLSTSRFFYLVFGLLVAVAVLLGVLGKALPRTRGWLWSMGSVSGFMGTVTGVGAPPIALLYLTQASHLARPTLAAFFAIGCGLSMLGLLSISQLGVQQFTVAAVMLPAMLIGTFAGRWLRNHLAKSYRYLLLATSGVAALVLILRGLNVTY